MGRVLICWLGKTDLRAANAEEDGLGPIGQALSKRAFDELLLLSNEPAKVTSSYVGWLRGRFDGGIQTQGVGLKDPTDHRRIYELAVAALQDLDGRYAKRRERLERVYHLSPGTPSMHAIWLLLAKTSYLGELIQTTPDGKVQTAQIPFDISAEFIPEILRGPDTALKAQSTASPPEAPEFEAIIHRCAPMKDVVRRARRVAPRSVPVLIEGESGTGKELFARAIHRASPRAEQPFVAVNCGAIPKDLVESELFGHRKGAFTGATETRKGYFREANGGTLFLDELGELPFETQVKLLRVLQENRVTPVGESRSHAIDVRIVAATNRTLSVEVAEGRFREDLFYRLAVAVLHLPPLRERSGDVGLLLDWVLEDVNEHSKTEPGYERKKYSAGARNLLLNHRWPGNVRELWNTVMRAAIWSEGATISKQDAEQALFASVSRQSDGILGRPLGNGFSLKDVLADVSRDYVQRALAETRGNKTQAAKLVGFSSHQVLSNWMEKFGITN